MSTMPFPIGTFYFEVIPTGANAHANGLSKGWGAMQLAVNGSDNQMQLTVPAVNGEASLFQTVVWTSTSANEGTITAPSTTPTPPPPDLVFAVGGDTYDLPEITVVLLTIGSETVPMAHVHDGMVNQQHVRFAALHSTSHFLDPKASSYQENTTSPLFTITVTDATNATVSVTAGSGWNLVSQHYTPPSVKWPPEITWVMDQITPEGKTTRTYKGVVTVQFNPTAKPGPAIEYQFAGTFSQTITGVGVGSDDGDWDTTTSSQPIILAARSYA